MADQISYHKAVQFFFYTQWNALKAYANRKGVLLVGDIPIYVSPDSSDLWTQPELFQTDGQMHLTHVAGCPPDSFAADGQLWATRCTIGYPQGHRLWLVEAAHEARHLYLRCGAH